MELKVESVANEKGRIVALGGTTLQGHSWLTTTQGVIVAMTEGVRFYTWNPDQKHKDYVRAVAVKEVEGLTDPEKGRIHLQDWGDSKPERNLGDLPACPLPTQEKVDEFKEIVRQG